MLKHSETNAPLPQVQVRDDEAPRHQLLGLTIPTMERFLVHIGFWGEGSTAEEVRPGTYKRAAEDAWLTDEYGDDLIGYDLATAIRHWLRSHDHDALSVCEVIQEWGWTDTSEEAVNKDGGAEGGATERAPPRPAVSQAQVFVSHVQSEPVDLTLERRDASSPFRATTLRRKSGTMITTGWTTLHCASANATSRRSGCSRPSGRSAQSSSCSMRTTYAARFASWRHTHASWARVGCYACSATMRHGRSASAS